VQRVRGSLKAAGLGDGSFGRAKPFSLSPDDATRRYRAGRDAQEGKGETKMSVAKVIEISSESPESFEDAIQKGIARATETVENIRGAWIKEQQVKVENGRITEYRVDMKVTFVLRGT
jgi:hypothetical protein